MTTTRPNIFVFHDYRAFLENWFDYLRQHDSEFSIRSLAKKSGLAVGYLSMVTKGKRRLSPKAVSRLRPHLELKEQELAYFELLRLISDSDSHEVRKDALDRAQRFRSYREANPKELEVYRYLTHWYYVAIREMAALPNFKFDARWVTAHLRHRITVREAEQALHFLKANGFIELKEGKHRRPNKAIECIGGVFRLALLQFHREMLQVTSELIASTPRDVRSVTGHTFAIPRQKYPELLRILNRTLEEVQSLESDKEEANTVYHVSLTATPLTK